MGTPTPEPPDFTEYNPLPAPRGAGFAADGRVLVSEHVDSGVAMVPLFAPRGTVPGDAEVTLINLDDPRLDPISLRAKADGSFQTTVLGRSGQRVRILYEKDGKHSLPLDLEVFGNFDAAAVRPLEVRDAISCLSVTPSAEITAEVASDATVTRAFTVKNACADAAELSRAELRFGDRGFRLTSPPDSVPANTSAELKVIFPGAPASGEASDIIIVDVRVGDLLERHALGVWAIPPREP